MIEVAIASVEAVFDWRAYLKSEFGYDENEVNSEDEKDENAEEETVLSEESSFEADSEDKES